MQDNFDQINKAIESLSFTLDEGLLKKFNITQKNNDLKTLKKKIKKSQVEEEDNNQKASQKVNKILEELYKNYQSTGKQYAKLRQIKVQVQATEAQREKINKSKVMTENLFNGFRKKYDQEIENAQKIEKEEEVNRKNIIEELQERIKTIQSKYEQTGKIKIQKYKQNQTLKHQLSKYQPHLAASQSLADAQLKKKSIEIEIQMTTLKQKIDMMDNFKVMRVQTQEKLKKSQQTEQKLGLRLTKIEGKEEQHKITLAKGHLIFQDYKKAFNVLKDILPKKQKQAFNANERLKKSVQVLSDFKKKLIEMDKQYQKQKNQLQVLSNLQSNLQKQLAQ